MPKLAAYSRELPYGYAPGTFPSHALLAARPQIARRLLVHSGAEGSDGVSALIEAARGLGVRVETADHALARISRKDNCYAAIVFDKYTDKLTASASHIVLDRPSDMGNLGTIFRSCLGFGFTQIAIIQPAADIFDPRTVRASMGALFSASVACYDSFDAYHTDYPSHAIRPFMLEASMPLSEAVASTSEPYSLVFGNEASGLDPAFAGLGQAVRIPHAGTIDSLNLSVAVSIAAYAFSMKADR